MLSDRLKYLRSTRDLTQRDLAEKINVTSGAVGMYESGKRFPNNEVLNRIADYFNVTADYLLGRTDNPSQIVQEDNKLTELLKDLDMLTDDEISDTFTSYLKKQDRVMFFDPESDRSPAEKRAILKELTKKEKKRQEKIDKLNKLPDDLLEEALCYAEFRAQKKSKK